MANLFSHLEKHLGVMAGGWQNDADGERMPFTVCRFDQTPLDGVDVLCTLGLGHYALSAGGTKVRHHELLVMYYSSEGYENWPGILQQVALQALGTKKAFNLGDVIGPRGELRDNSTVSALYVAPPVYLPDEFSVFDAAYRILFGWLVPITEREAQFVKEYGRDRFDDLLEDKQPDVFNLYRGSLV